MTEHEMMEDMWQQSKKQTALAERTAAAMERIADALEAPRLEFSPIPAPLVEGTP